MATNPMQRKSRQSFLLGMVVMLLIAGAAIAFLWMQMSKMKKQIDDEVAQKSSVKVLKQDIKSGAKLTSDMFDDRDVTKNAIPTGYVDVSTLESEYVAKIDLKANSILTEGMISKANEKTTKDMREQTYNMLSLPIDLQDGEYVDIRLMLPDGTDFIVLPKKQVTIPLEGGMPASDTIKINVSETDILTMSSAIVEAYRIKGSKLYAIKYTEAGNQDAATVTYKPRNDVVTLIENNPNIVEEASKYLYNNLATKYRNDKINSYYNSGNAEDVASGIQESTQKTQESREKYLGTLEE